MNQDKQIRTYWIFLLILSLLALGTAFLCSVRLTGQIQDIYSSQNAAMASSLLAVVFTKAVAMTVVGTPWSSREEAMAAF